MSVRQISPNRWYCDGCHNKFADRLIARRHLKPDQSCRNNAEMVEAGLEWFPRTAVWRASRVSK